MLHLVLCVQIAISMTSPDVLAPERLTDSLVVPALHQAGTSVAQLAYAALRNAILAMDAYDPEADLRLDEKRLAADLGVSRTPVREALVRLEHEGLVRIMPRRGVYVVRKSKAEVIEMIIAWAALESMAARLMCERAGDEEIEGLLQRVERRVGEGTAGGHGQLLADGTELPSGHGGYPGLTPK